MASEGPPLAKPQPPESTQDEDDEDLKTLLLYGNIAIDDSDGEWVLSKILAIFEPYSDPVAAWLSRKHFVAQLNIEELAMLKISRREKSPEITDLMVEKMVLLWLQSESTDHTKLKKAKVELARVIHHLDRPLWRGGGYWNDGEPLSLAELKDGHASPRFEEFLSSSYNSTHYRLTEISGSDILCKLYLRGACTQGSACPFSHDVQRARQNICKFPRGATCGPIINCPNLHILRGHPMSTQGVHNARFALDKEEKATSTIRPMTERYIEEPNSRDIEPITQLREIVIPSKPFEPRSQPNRIFSRPGQSLASYHSAQSSLRENSLVATNFSSGFYSGSSRRTPRSFQQSPAYYSAKSSLATNADRTIMEAVNNPLSGYLKAVHEKGLVLPLDQELNWSGKENGGQHVEYAKGENLPFEVIGPIGASLTAQVDKVRCRRILLARKTMICGRRMTVEEALVEVEHLHNLRHPHIIQLVGSYLQGKKFSVLLYPVADCDLSVFLDEVHDLVQETTDLKTRGATTKEPLPPAISSMWSFFGCLADAMRYIHSTARKHLDIKPGNILVRKHPQATYGYRVYIADFGISRSFKSLDHSQTETHIRRTPKYCAPEVWYQDVHGRAADIFSLGCVFMEMLTVLCGCKCDVEDFAEFRAKHSDSSGAYHETLHRVDQWSIHLRRELEGYYMYDNFFRTFETSGSLVPKVRGMDATFLMLEREPEKRRLPIFNRGEPGEDGCHTCGDGLESYEYAEEV
ncbi:hypothetical protein VTL71DRAFT_9821 [Oculimacula yallundae]|uniref:Kinase-like protein n=1 Tax=Oculimacula yallundae TaxID=86028 RepID=A0ABR4BQK0_9HELO